MEPAEEVADETVELTVEVTEPAPLEVEATTRCVAGSAVLATTLTNPGDEPVTASVATPHGKRTDLRSEEHTSELQSRGHLVCRLLLEKKKIKQTKNTQKN